jgi:hypothetical protein
LRSIQPRGTAEPRLVIFDESTDAVDGRVVALDPAISRAIQIASKSDLIETIDYYHD